MVTKTYNLAPGTYSVTVAKQGYTKQEQQVTITNANKSITVNLLKAGVLTIAMASGQSVPTGAKITITDGNNYKILDNANLSSYINYSVTGSSTYKVTVTADGYNTFQQTITVGDTEEKTCSIALSLIKYTLTVTATPDGAEVTVRDSGNNLITGT